MPRNPLRRWVRPPALFDLEWAVFTGRFRRARRLGRRLVRRQPRQSNVLFLYAAALLALKDHRRLRRDIEPKAAALPAGARAAVAYILMISAIQQGDPDMAGRWADEAAKDPEFRQRTGRADAAQADAAQTAYA